MIFFHFLIIISSLIFSIIIIIYVLIHREYYGSNLNILLIISIFIFIGIFYIIIFNFSYILLSKRDIAIILWKFSIVIGTYSLVLLTSLHCILLEDNKLNAFTVFYGAILNGIILSIILSPNSVKILSTNQGDIFIITDINLSYYILLLYISFMFLACIIQLRNFHKIYDKEIKQKLNLLLIMYLFSIILYLFYIFFRIPNLKFFPSILYLFGAIYVFFSILKKSNFFIILTSKIYNFIIIHRSGILLYSYDFESNDEADFSLLKGSILIGISHILTNFKKQQEKLNLIKMKNRDIIFKYDNKRGYALLLITNKKNKNIEKKVVQFILEFNKKYGEILRKMNKNITQLIDISIFKGSKEILYKIFHPYFKNIKSNK
ncbi:MAG: hypothetical protein ACTSPD_09275 [Promethearchaeota archaeon]